MKKLLILGGTQFIGRNLVERLLEMDSYDITLFNRQQTQADLFPEIKKLKGDRETDDIKQIADENWDYVIDLSCYYPDSLEQALQCLTDSVKKYILISTCSVYDTEKNQSILRTEQTEILPCTDEQRTDRTNATYGNRKAACERILTASGINHVMLRPSLVYGRYEHTDRFYYWLYQVKHNHRLLLPDNGERTFSLTYVNDLVETIILALTLDTQSNIYSVISNLRTSIKEIVNISKELLRKDCQTLNASPAFLSQNNINEWTDMPLWLNSEYHTYDNRKLREDFGIELTPLQDSIRDTVDYYNTLSWSEPIYGMSEGVRMELMAQIKAMDALTFDSSVRDSDQPLP